MAHALRIKEEKDILQLVLHIPGVSVGRCCAGVRCVQDSGRRRHGRMAMVIPGRNTTTAGAVQRQGELFHGAFETITHEQGIRSKH